MYETTSAVIRPWDRPPAKDDKNDNSATAIVSNPTGWSGTPGNGNSGRHIAKYCQNFERRRSRMNRDEMIIEKCSQKCIHCRIISNKMVKTAKKVLYHPIGKHTLVQPNSTPVYKLCVRPAINQILRIQPQMRLETLSFLTWKPSATTLRYILLCRTRWRYHCQNKERNTLPLDSKNCNYCLEKYFRDGEVSLNHFRISLSTARYWNTDLVNMMASHDPW